MLLLILADEKYNTQKIPVLFSRPKKILASFIDSIKIPFGQNVRPKKILGTPPRPPVIKICEWGPWGQIPHPKKFPLIFFLCFVQKYLKT